MARTANKKKSAATKHARKEPAVAKAKVPASRAPVKMAAPAARKAPPAKQSAPAAKQGAATPAKLSKDELRVQVEKLERANATLRTKSRDAARAGKTAAARIAELEDELTQLQQQLDSHTARAARSAKAKMPRRSPRREIDPGDAVPPGVAVEDPEEPDEEAESAKENLEAHLGENSDC